MSEPSKRFLVVSNEIQDPPYGSDAMSNGYCFDLDVARMQNSDSWVLCPPDIRPWMMMSWVISWAQHPCGSLPSDDELIAARLGCPLEFLQVHQRYILRGWVRHSDGRMYHPVVTEIVTKMLGNREKWKAKKKGQRPEKRECPASVPGDTSENTEGVSGVSRPYSYSYSYSSSSSSSEEKSSPEREKPKPDARGARLTLTDLPQDWRDYLTGKRPDLDPVETWERFRDYWIAQPGQKGVKTDWLATWRNWIRNENARGNGNGGSQAHQQRTSAADKRAEISRGFIERGLAAAREPVD